MAQFVDWDLATATAGALGKSGPHVSFSEAADVVADLRRLTDDAAGHVLRYTGMHPMVTHPPVRVVDRRDWAATNILGLRQVINPLVSQLIGDKEPGAFTTAVGSRLTGVQAGTVLAYLSGKVLGQYEVFSADPGILLLVAPNVVEVERKLVGRPARLPAVGLPARGHPPHPVHGGAVAARPLPRRGARVRGRLAGRRPGLRPAAAGDRVTVRRGAQPGQPGLRPRPGADARRRRRCWTGSPR